MRKYLLVILLISIGMGQDNKNDSFVNESTFSNPKLYCSECKLPMRETITRYVCRDNHMSVKKSNVKIDNNGKLYISKDGELKGLSMLTHTPSPMNFLNQILKRPNNEKPFVLLVIGKPKDDCVIPAFAEKKKSFSKITSIF